MYVRDARNRDEVWLLDHIEAMGLDETAFRSHDYVIAVDDETGERAGFGRLRLHPHPGDPQYCELTSIGVLEAWREQGVGAHVVERLVQTAAEKFDFEVVYALSSNHAYLEQFGFMPIDRSDLPEALAERLDTKRESLDPEAIPLRIDPTRFRMPARLREHFKAAAADRGEEPEPTERPEDFGIDPDRATYKYDTGR
jgi:N-acetylglutamate synthase-like GNAT family acetyltransferase